MVTDELFKIVEIHYTKDSMAKPRQQRKQTNAKTKNRHRVLFIGIILSILVVIASIACVSIILVKNKNITDSKNANGDSHRDGSDLSDDRREENDGEHSNNNNSNSNNEGIAGKEDNIDWHARSIPIDDQNQDNGGNFDEGIFPDKERDDILMDDQYNDNYVISFNSNNTEENKKAKKDIDFSLFFCPAPGDPLIIDLPDIVAFNNNGEYHRILLESSSPGILCTLLEVSTDTEKTVDGDLQLKPIGRSYNGHGWEPYHGRYSTIVPLTCTDPNNNSSGDCLVVLPPLSVGRTYVLKSYEYSLGKRDEAARFLERTTFGATTSEINAFVAGGSDHVDWIRNQLKLPISSHRQFFRERATNFHAETTWMGTLAFGPCQRGAQYRKFVFVSKDTGRFLSISPSPINRNYKVLSVGGHIRSVIPGRVKLYISATNKTVVPDGRYARIFIDDCFTYIF